MNDTNRPQAADQKNRFDSEPWEFLTCQHATGCDAKLLNWAEVKQAMTQRFAQRWLGALATGTIRPVIDSTYSLAEAAQAHRRMESGQSVGKILLLPEPISS